MSLRGALCSIPINLICNMTTFRKKSFDLLTLPQGLKGVYGQISYLELWRPSCSVKRNLYAILEEGKCEGILNFDQWFRRCHLKKVSR